MVTNDQSIDLEALKSNLSFMRRTLGLSTKEFAEQLGIKPNSVWRWEKQGAVPQISNLRLVVNLWNKQGIPKIDIITLSTSYMMESEKKFKSRDTIDGDISKSKIPLNLGIKSFEQDRRVLVTLKVTMDEMLALKEIVSSDIVDYIDTDTWKGLLFALRESRAR